MSDPLPQSDQTEGAPHPRETPLLIGQSRAEAAFLEAFTSERLHHGWLITGPRGVGKATLAWRLARFLIATPPAGVRDMFGPPPGPEAEIKTLDIAADHPVAIRVAALSDPNLYLLRRSYDAEKKAFKAQIGVDDVRAMKHFFAMSSTDGARRVVIVDAADDMNVNAANALLKLLEEPPRDTVLLLVSHQPSRLLPTIRSRCRELRCETLEANDIARILAQSGAETGKDATALAELAGGSAGEALALLNLDGVELYAELLAIAASFPRLDRPRANRFAASLAGRDAQERLDLFIRLSDVFLARLSRAGLGLHGADAAPSEAEVLTRLCPDPPAARRWADAAPRITGRLRHGRAVNLDPALLVLDMVHELNSMAAKTAA